LDKVVDLCYRPQAFTSERNQIEFLFELYEQYTAPLLKQKPAKKRKHITIYIVNHQVPHHIFHN